MDLKEFIQERRPNISKSSITTYNSILKNLYKSVFPNDELDIKNFDNSEKILKYLSNIEPNNRKTILSALVVITDNKDYRDKMLDDIKEYNKEISKQEKNKNQEDSWIDKEEIDKIYSILYHNAKLLYKKDSLTNSDLQEIQNYIIISLLGGIYIPPRRSKDYVDFKISDIDKSEDNYIEKNKLIFNSYKTAKTYGEQKVEIPKALKSILNKWIKVNPTKYLLFDTNMGKLSNVKLNQRLNKILGKKASVNQLRHTFLTEKYGDMIDTKKQLDEDFKQMGSSSGQFQTYVKK